MQYAHPVVEAVKAVVIHLIGSAAMLDEGLSDYCGGGGGQCMHKRKLKVIMVITKLI